MVVPYLFKNHTMKKIALLLFIMITLSCSDNDDNILPACGVVNPLEELPWLKAEKDRRENNPTADTKYCYISQAEYNNQTVFIYFDCNPLINKVIPIYDCEGNLLNDSPENEISFEELTNTIIIWKPADFVCETT